MDPCREAKPSFATLQIPVPCVKQHVCEDLNHTCLQEAGDHIVLQPTSTSYSCKIVLHSDQELEQYACSI